MPLHSVKRGLDIPIAGAASGDPVSIDTPATLAYVPTELRGIVPRLAAREGDRVKRGSPLFHAKGNPDMKFLAPASGVVKEVRRGRRRVITDIVVEVEGDEAEAFKTWDLPALKGMKREQAVGALLAGGLWSYVRTRPLNTVADPEKTPQSILIGAMETGPLQPGLGVLVGADENEAMQAGVHLLNALTDGKVFLAKQSGDSHPALAGLDGVEVHEFSGPHPAGDPAVQVNLVDPPRGQNKVWWIRAWEVVLIGRLLLEGRFPAERVYAAIGKGVKNPRYVRTLLGAPIADVAGELTEGDVRVIRGSVLTGAQTDAERWMGWYTRSVHVLPAKVEKDLFGWWLPKIGEFSFHRAFLSGFTGGSGKYDIRPGLWGGHRGMVPLGNYRKVIATPDIEPEFLFKSILAGDLEESINLGLLDITEEEAALCTYICPSKIEFDEILQQGLELYEKEAG